MSRRTLALAVGAAVVVAAVAVGVGLAVLGGDDEAAGTTATTGTVAAPVEIETSSLAAIRGIPQAGQVLGEAGAPVTLVEYADLQCPFCAEFSQETFPQVVARWVRDGSVKVDFRGLRFLGEDSEKALRFALAAAQEDKLWDVVELLYENQGEENSGWVTDGLLRAVAEAAGLDYEQTAAAAAELPASALEELEAQAQADGVEGTPAFYVSRTGGTSVLVGTGALTIDQFEPAIDAALTP